MKKFAFPLERVLGWRRAGLRREEIKLEQMRAGVRALEAALALLNSEVDAAASQMRAQAQVEGEELRSLDAFQRFAAAERGRMAEARAAGEQKIAAQMQVLARHRQGVKLLEKLKEQRLAEWRRAAEREAGQQAEESHLARWNRENIQ